MNEVTIRKIIEVNNVLAEWDPKGIGLHDMRYTHSEYIQYISPIIAVCEAKQSMVEYLITLKLSLAGGVNDIIKNDIIKIAEKIEAILT